MRGRARSAGFRKRLYLRRGDRRSVEPRQPTASAAPAACGAAVRARRGCDEEAPDPRGGGRAAVPRMRKRRRIRTASPRHSAWYCAAEDGRANAGGAGTDVPWRWSSGRRISGAANPAEGSFAVWTARTRPCWTGQASPPRRQQPGPIRIYQMGFIRRHNPARDRNRIVRARTSLFHATNTI